MTGQRVDPTQYHTQYTHLVREENKEERNECLLQAANDVEHERRQRANRGGDEAGEPKHGYTAAAQPRPGSVACSVAEDAEGLDEGRRGAALLRDRRVRMEEDKEQRGEGKCCTDQRMLPHDPRVDDARERKPRTCSTHCFKL